MKTAEGKSTNEFIGTHADCPVVSNFAQCNLENPKENGANGIGTFRA
jgi:hypothetical protein